MRRIAIGGQRLLSLYRERKERKILGMEKQPSNGMRSKQTDRRSIFMQKIFPSPPEIVKGPWTPHARHRALNHAVHEHYIAYFGRAMKQRNWSPWHDLPLSEIGERGHQLSEDTLHLIEGFLGVEEYVGNYVQEGLDVFRDNRTRRNMHLQWGSEEAKHGVVWELVLKHSQARTEEQLTAYLDQVRDSCWGREQHTGVDSPLGATVYAMVQERTTFFHYQAMRTRIRQEYGLPPAPTPGERQRGYEIGAAEACRIISQDELAHHGLFLQIVRSALTYLPSLTCDTLRQVFASFKMPALRFLPNSRAYLRAIKRTNLYSRNIHTEKIHKPLLKSLGLADPLDPYDITLNRGGD
jgi:acyl-[acyl-carrier-protein] desaturase